MNSVIGIIICIGFMLFAYGAGYKDGRESELKNKKTCPMCGKSFHGIKVICEACSFDSKN